ncbi:hypothetical protein SteCoe_1794 [Stentor coeruleus]|uniref:Uncharacterized protein n=1 Tax=Stentor coeruleus TaxID=5963 RepID=A0A1R2D101_9CILI|nr:hypothetical protein SteCoe_1794 [Stentor coeruleus]
MLVIFFLDLVQSLNVTAIPKFLTPPTPRRSASGIHCDEINHAFLFGGGSQFGEPYSDQMWKFGIDNKDWEQVSLTTPVMPEGRVASAMATVDDMIYMYGGACDHGPSADFWSFNVTENVWFENDIKGDKPGPVAYSAYANYEWNNIDYMAMFGGYSETSATNNFYILNLHTLEWKQYKNDFMPKPRVGAAMDFNTEDNSLYLWGMSEGNEKNESLAVYVFSLITEKWSILETDYKNLDAFKPRSFHGLAVYKNSMFVMYGSDLQSNIEFEDVLELDIKKGEWKVFDKAINMKLSMFATVPDGGVYYLFCGGDSESEFNSVYKMDFENRIMTELFENTYIFDRRHSYTLFRVGTDLILFGGADHEKIYNDVYIFDLITEKWAKVVASGTPPAPRYGHCSAIFQSLYLVVFGGRDFDTEFNDFFIYNLRTNKWSEFFPTPKPEPRYGCCMTTHEKFVIIHGGKTPSSVSSEIISVDMHNLDVTYADTYNIPSLKLKLFNHKCWCHHAHDGKTLDIFIATGEYITGKTSNSIFFLNYDIDNKAEKATARALVDLNESYSWSAAGVTSTSNWCIIIGGKKWSMYTSNKIFAVKIDEDSTNTTADIHDFDYENKTYLYSIDTEHYSNYIYIGFSGAGYSNMIKEHFILTHFYKIHPNKFNEFDIIECSSGTYGENCLPCDYGSYKEDTGNKTCDFCPEGTYNKNLASSSKESCFPCPFNFFNNQTGKERCLECGKGNYCPVGSINESFLNETIENYDHQPQDYASKSSDPFDGRVYYFVYFTGTLLFLMYLFYPNFRNKLSKIDYFTEKHNTKIGKPVVKFRTSLGGLFTTVFCIFQVIFIAQQFTAYRENNILETKALVPAITREEIFAADSFIIDTDFLYYPGTCILEEILNESKDEDNKNKDEAIAKANSYTECSEFFYRFFTDIDGEVTCYKPRDSNNCRVRFKKSGLILNGDSSITYNFCEFAALSSGIRVTVESSSSIPGEASKESFILEYKNGTVFRGTQKSEFFFEVTRSVFESDSSDWPTGTTGYHIGQENSPNHGDSLSGDDINFEQCVGVTINLGMSGAVLVTKRIFKLTFMLTISSAIASVFGILEMFGMAMIMTERVEEFITKRYKSQKNLVSVIGARFNIANSFEYQRPDTGKKLGYSTSPTRSGNFKTRNSPSTIFPVGPTYLDTTQVADLDN